MMNIMNIFIFFVFLCTLINARWILEKSDHDLIDRDDNWWYIKCIRPVNRPTFPAYIRFYNTHTAKSEYEIDCSRSSQVLYYNVGSAAEIIFLTTDHFWSEGDSYYVTLDEGVLFSDYNETSTAYLNPKFWRFTVVRPMDAPNPEP